MAYCMECHKENCDCQTDILSRIEKAKITLSVAEYHIMILRRDRFELISALKRLMETCPADPDATEKFLDANEKALQLIERLENQTK
jgi:hypothetical protein